MRRVCVLLCSYNGRDYINEQIDSILAQRSVDVSLYVRDDGSTDGTQEILDNYQGRGLLNWRQGENVGAAVGFMELLYEYSAKGFDYYAFADQDDIWFEDKLFRAIEAITASGSKYVLYGANQTLYKDASPAGNVYDEVPNLEVPYILNHNRIAGCTVVMNEALAMLITNATHIDNEVLRIRMHDIWLVLAADVCGEVIFDLEPCMFYRIHSSNVVGEADDRLSTRYKKSAVCNKSKRNSRSLFAQELLRCLGEYMDDKTRDTLELYANYRKSLSTKRKFLRAKDVICLTGENPTVFRLKILLNYI